MNDPRKALRFIAAASLVALAASRPAAAQGFAADLHAGYFGMAASESAKAVFGSTGGLTLGGGIRYGFGKHLFVEAGARVFSKDGERVFVASAGGPVAHLGFPLKARLIPAYATIGYRFGRGKSVLVPYLGVGGGVTSYREESTVAGLALSESQSKASGHALVGLEYGRGHVRFAAEAIYTTVPNALGVGGVSKVYGEDNLGGFCAQGKLIFSRRTR